VLVSVIIPAYNQGDYLADAVASVIGQTYGDLEIIVVDDGSTDDTAEIARSIDDGRLRYIYQKNRGLSGARNSGIRNSRGEYLTFLDSDDLFLPAKLKLLVGALEGRPDAGIAAGQAVPIDERGERIGRVFDTPLPDDPVDLLLANPLHVGSVMLRRSWQEKVGYFDESLRSYEDWDMWLRLAVAGCPSIWVSEPVSLYRFHQAQMTRIGNQMTAATFAVLDKFFSRTDLTRRWTACKDPAYSRAHLRAAAQAYRARDYRHARDHIGRAVKQNPRLTDGGLALLANHFYSWTELPKIKDPIDFLDDIYSHLPPELSWLARQKNSRVGQAAARLAFESFSKRDYPATRSFALKALRYRPSFLMNWGLVSILGRSFVNR